MNFNDQLLTSDSGPLVPPKPQPQPHPAPISREGPLSSEGMVKGVIPMPMIPTPAKDRPWNPVNPGGRHEQ